MDDSMDSVDSEADAIELCSQLSQLWSLAGMRARKWLSNSHVVLDSIPPDDRATEIDLNAGHLQSVKTLGVLWESKCDMFGLKPSPPDSEFRFTKRNVLSKVATIFDLLGFLPPYVI
ncbi:PREDICTED: uncharacterized protein LOC106816195 [Priapulus caudatus]|uniref:Uncharacterized protein LOC106816195 n=1 Tax=Priapulus caudatus TaxID=37621 RepID=A0ABM1EVM3_PRICU|nr:PREDICTED: uncharacterized protein LOC106816195 [Priapulus caudatus]